MVGGKILIIYGENSYEKALQINKIKQNAEKSGFLIENIDPENMSQSDFISTISGISLFSEKRLVIMRDLSENTDLWKNFLALSSRISSDVFLCLIENKIDKRTKFIKDLAKTAEFKECKNLTDKDNGIMVEFARKIAKSLKLQMSLDEAKFLVSWVGVNEWAARDAVNRLAIFGSSDENAIREIIPQNIEANAFEVLRLAFKGDTQAVSKEIKKLKLSEGDDGAYRFFGLIISNIFNLSAVKFANPQMSISEIAKKIGANSWALNKNSSDAKDISKDKIKRIIESATEIDKKIKTASVDPWEMIEILLMKISQ